MSVQKLLDDKSYHHYKDPSKRGQSCKRWLHLYIKDLGLNSWEMGVLIITRIPPEGGKKQEMVAPVYEGSGVKLVGDGSSHHYKDPS